MKDNKSSAGSPIPSARIPEFRNSNFFSTFAYSWVVWHGQFDGGWENIRPESGIPELKNFKLFNDSSVVWHGQINGGWHNIHRKPDLIHPESGFPKFNIFPIFTDSWVLRHGLFFGGWQNIRRKPELFRPDARIPKISHFCVFRGCSTRTIQWMITKHPPGIRNSNFFNFYSFLGSWSRTVQWWMPKIIRKPKFRNPSSRAFRLQHPRAMLYERALYHPPELFHPDKKSKHQPGERGRILSQAKARSVSQAKVTQKIAIF